MTKQTSTSKNKQRTQEAQMYKDINQQSQKQRKAAERNTE
jgi:hypothetical protein